MRFRPCIDIHDGKVKQIVGGSLNDLGAAEENYVSEQDAGYYGALYREDGLTGGHMILLNQSDSAYYEADKRQAALALAAFPGGLQVGGGINAENAGDFLELGASHVIVTSYVFSGGRIQYEHLERLRREAGKERIVLDLSCRKRNGLYYIVTDRWQNFTESCVKTELFEELAGYCSEFLVHAVDVEGKRCGIEAELISILAGAAKGLRLPVTYAGGIAEPEDILRIGELGGGLLDYTVGSALDLFGGKLSYRQLCGWNSRSAN